MFTTPWGIFHYAKMPFSLKNVGATFQRAMDLAFANEKDAFLVVYMDDLTVFSKSDEEHMYHLKTIFQKCRNYGLSLNSKKSLFAMEEGKLLRHIISKNGIHIDPARVQAIQQIELPQNKKEIQSFNDIIYVVKYLSPPPDMTRNKAGTLKLKAAKFCILNSALYWKDPNGVLLNFLVGKEAKKVIKDCHQGDCGGHPFWKSTANKILRVGYYWLTLFADVYKMVKSCHKCQIFEGRQKLQPLPLKPIEVSAPFQQWGLDFTGEIHPASSDQHRWILIETYCFTKWIEAIPTRQATDAVIISFLENNILSRFGCTNKLIIDNATAFKSKRMVEFCHKYHIILGHSTTYHPQNNGLVESSNKSLVSIIKKLMEINKKSCHKRLVNALWADRVSQKKSIGTSPFELVYGVDTVFPTSLAAPVVKLLQEAGSEDDPMQRRLNQMVHLQQTREEVFQSTSKL
eukprot:PITA_03249